MRSFGKAVLNWILGLLMACEAWWFDRSRRVQTSGTTALNGLNISGDASDSNPYIPVRPSRARKALGALPVHDHFAYTFVDIGSGKGRMLLLAAEYPFRKIVGIEFAAELNDRALRNIASYRSRKQRCREIESLRMDALDFWFPDGNLVLYLFNPFGLATMQRLLERLEHSLDRNPRDVLVVTVFPEFDSLFSATRHFTLYRRMRRCHIFRSMKSAA
jgi:SAM-dependent methyltransferase